MDFTPFMHYKMAYWISLSIVFLRLKFIYLRRVYPLFPHCVNQSYVRNIRIDSAYPKNRKNWSIVALNPWNLTCPNVEIVQPLPNLTRAERVPLQRLKKNENIIVTMADKGDTKVIMDPSHLVELAHKHLSNRNSLTSHLKLWLGLTMIGFTSQKTHACKQCTFCLKYINHPLN